MSARHAKIEPTGREVTFDENDIIVSKTDLRGHLTYTNDVFIKVSGFTERELIGQPHNIIRHPDMPGCIFKVLWDTLARGEEIFAYVKNMCKDGSHYWVFAHVTPSYDRDGRIIGYHSNRRVPYADAVAQVKDLYRDLLAEERKHTNRREAVAASEKLLFDLIARTSLDYSQFVFQLSANTSLESIAA